MSTRGLMGCLIDGQLKAGYNHSDSYPDYLGCNMLDFVKRLLAADGVDEAAELARKLIAVDGNVAPTDEQVAALRKWSNRSVGTRSEADWYVLLRETQGDPDATLAAGYIEDDRGFGLDPFSCEWGYVVNFDDMTLEVYRGGSTPPTGIGRGIWDGGTEQNPDGKSHIALICRVGFAEAGTLSSGEFLKRTSGDAAAE